MSRIGKLSDGKKPVPVPRRHRRDRRTANLTVKGPKGTLTLPRADDISYSSRTAASR